MISIKTRSLLPNQTQHSDISKARKNKAVLDGSEFDTASEIRTKMYKEDDENPLIEVVTVKGKIRKLHAGLVTDVLAPMFDALTYQERISAYAKHNLIESGEYDRIREYCGLSARKPNNVIDLFR